MNLKKVRKHLRDYSHVLVLMRHAKAQSSAPSDMERKLSDKGAKQAKLVAGGLAELGFTPQRIISSSARRATQTLDALVKGYGDDPSVDLRRNIYDGGADAILHELSHLKDSVRSLMIIGHEPALSMAAQALAAPSSKASVLNLINLGLPSAAVIILAANSPMASWRQSPAQAIAIITAKDFA